jgi:hypothetical protein
MAIKATPGQKIRVTISNTITRDAARKTIERLFCKDKSITKPIGLRSRNFIELPKRRGGCIWTKRVNKVHPNLDAGQAATIIATPQALRDLASVEKFIEIAAA